jgi:hypothetical protein
MLSHLSKNGANAAINGITASTQDSYAYSIRFYDRGIAYRLPVFGKPSSHFWVRTGPALMFSRLFQPSRFYAEE